MSSSKPSISTDGGINVENSQTVAVSGRMSLNGST